MSCGIVVIDENRCAILRYPYLVYQSSRLHRTDDGGLTNHRGASASVNKRAKCHSPSVPKPRGYTNKTEHQRIWESMGNRQLQYPSPARRLIIKPELG